MILSICDIPVEFRFQDDPFSEELRERYAAFETDRPPLLLLRVESLPEAGPGGDASDIEVVAEDQRREIRRFDFTCRYEDPAGGEEGEIRTWPRLISFDGILRVLYTMLLVGRGGALLHAAGIRHGAEALVFPGASGAGKSTLAGKAPEADVLTDELVGLRLDPGGRAIAYGTPFWGELRRGDRAVSFPAAGIYHLAQGPAAAIRDLSGGEAIRSLYEQSLFFSSYPGDHQRLLDTLKGITESTPTAELTLPEDLSFEEILVCLGREA